MSASYRDETAAVELLHRQQLPSTSPKSSRRHSTAATHMTPVVGASLALPVAFSSSFDILPPPLPGKFIVVVNAVAACRERCSFEANGNDDEEVASAPEAKAN